MDSETMDVGCGGIGLRTSHGDVVNLYFWHLDDEDGVRVRREDFLGRADSPGVKRELLRRMAMYNRRAEQRLARQIAKLERQLTRIDRKPKPIHGIGECDVGTPPAPVALVFPGAQGI